LNKAKILYL